MDSTEMASQPPSQHLKLSSSAALKALGTLADTWGGGWKGEGSDHGRLVIPVLAGLRRGYVGYAVTARSESNGTRLHFVEEESDLQVHTPTLIVLLIAAVAGLSTLVMPFVPRLLPLLPPAIVLCLATWLFIVARLRNSGLDEFLQDLAGEAGSEEE